ncbi:hypothetical protein SLEP1_g13994 [Rubroshorea leprosula]|uniref:Ribosomal protein L20 n=1 Tax=Rubroshorea leprosula TaxID=152421 RepID=A0AAV5IQL5_9ROSI|nr:hypothetical protein SLEP1_g13994 [Rubroshorea leprosula]
MRGHRAKTKMKMKGNRSQSVASLLWIKKLIIYIICKIILKNNKKNYSQIICIRYCKVGQKF